MSTGATRRSGNSKAGAIGAGDGKPPRARGSGRGRGSSSGGSRSRDSKRVATVLPAALSPVAKKRVRTAMRGSTASTAPVASQYTAGQHVMWGMGGVDSMSARTRRLAAAKTSKARANISKGRVLPLQMGRVVRDCDRDALVVHVMDTTRKDAAVARALTEYVWRMSGEKGRKAYQLPVGIDTVVVEPVLSSAADARPGARRWVLPGGACAAPLELMRSWNDEGEVWDAPFRVR